MYTVAKSAKWENEVSSWKIQNLNLEKISLNVLQFIHLLDLHQVGHERRSGAGSEVDHQGAHLPPAPLSQQAHRSRALRCDQVQDGVGGGPTQPSRFGSLDRQTEG